MICCWEVGCGDEGLLCKATKPDYTQSLKVNLFTSHHCILFFPLTLKRFTLSEIDMWLGKVDLLTHPCFNHVMQAQVCVGLPPSCCILPLGESDLQV